MLAELLHRPFAAVVVALDAPPRKKSRTVVSVWQPRVQWLDRITPAAKQPAHCNAPAARPRRTYAHLFHHLSAFMTKIVCPCQIQ
jgi:hypothetical protein